MIRLNWTATKVSIIKDYTDKLLKRTTVYVAR